MKDYSVLDWTSRVCQSSSRVGNVLVCAPPYIYRGRSVQYSTVGESINSSAVQL